jgi:shikimate dehydrogenase
MGHRMNKRDISLVGVIGNPISHSKSPEIHNKWIKDAGIKAFYTPIWVENAHDLPQVLKTMPKMGFIGCNITVPYKEAVYEYLVQNRFKMSEEVREIGAVNTLVFEPEICAYNTDCWGFVDSLGFDVTGKNVLVIGAGGAGKAVIYGLIKRGAKVEIANRTPKNIFDIQTQSLENVDISEYDIIVNTTSIGLKGDVLPINYEAINSHQTCVDIIYTQTPFLTNCAKNGAKTINGQGMLVAQAALAFNIWFFK